MRRIPISGGSVKSSDASTAIPMPCAAVTKSQCAVGSKLEIAREKRREDPLDDEPERDTEQAAGEPERDGLEQVDPHDVAGSRADAFHDRDGIHALLDVRAHGGADADGSDDQRDQAHQAEKCRGSIQGLRDDGMRLAKIGNQGVGEGGF